MLLELDGPSVQDLLTFTTTVVELKVGATTHPERKVITIQPQTGKVRVFWVSGLALNHGVLIAKNQLVSFEAAESQKMYIAADSGSVDVVVIERA